MSKVNELKERLFDVNALNAATAVLDWDHQCYMPDGGNAARAEHGSRLSRMAHEMFVSEETQRTLSEAAKEANGDSEEAAFVRVVQRQMAISTKLPAEFVARKVKRSTEAHEIWVKARKENNFAHFAPALAEMMDLAREEAEYLGYIDHPYDALTDQYEEGATKKSWEAMFDSVRQPLVDLVREINESPNQPDNSFLTGKWEQEDQRKFTEMLVQAIGFDFERGRQDIAAHPFCTNFSVGDVRLTTRYEDYLGSAIFGSLHEAGHGMYEQGSPMEWDRTALAGGVSLGVHESQSRLWENIVGRSRPFWQHFLPQLQGTFPALSNVNLDHFYRGINKVEPTFIRVEADEVTYNLHIMVRFELECALVSGELKVADLPEAWNEKYNSYLGITPTSDSVGCLQDVHWSAALIGYFPTYSKGNLLSYQIWNALQKDIPNTDELMAKGHFKPILDWLIDKIYRHGSRYQPEVLMEMATGERMNPEHYLKGIRAKYAGVYSL
ncbi:MAG: carboxypeptidase M32 [Fimbriimonadaceae bacterium]|nr:carboxypeptidase M32 [Fimbriimonadaceae bacterium]